MPALRVYAQASSAFSRSNTLRDCAGAEASLASRAPSGRGPAGAPATAVGAPAASAPAESGPPKRPLLLPPGPRLPRPPDAGLRLLLCSDLCQNPETHCLRDRE